MRNRIFLVVPLLFLGVSSWASDNLWDEVPDPFYASKIQALSEISDHPEFYYRLMNNLFIPPELYKKLGAYPGVQISGYPDIKIEADFLFDAQFLFEIAKFKPKSLTLIGLQASCRSQRRAFVNDKLYVGSHNINDPIDAHHEFTLQKYKDWGFNYPLFKASIQKSMPDLSEAEIRQKCDFCFTYKKEENRKKVIEWLNLKTLDTLVAGINAIMCQPMCTALYLERCSFEKFPDLFTHMKKLSIVACSIKNYGGFFRTQSEPSSPYLLEEFEYDGFTEVNNLVHLKKLKMPLQSLTGGCEEENLLRSLCSGCRFYVGWMFEGFSSPTKKKYCEDQTCFPCRRDFNKILKNFSHSKLEILDLSFSDMTNKEAMVFSQLKLPSLRKLILKGNQVSDGAVSWILKQNPSFEFLDVSENFLTPAYVDELKLLDFPKIYAENQNVQRTPSEETPFWDFNAEKFLTFEEWLEREVKIRDAKI